MTIKDVPDCYVKVTVGAEPEYRTPTVDNDHNPVWNATHDFLITDFEQVIALDVQDDDTATTDDDIGLGQTTVKDILLNGGTHELDLTHKGDPTGAKLTIHAKFFNLVAEPNMLSAGASEVQGQDQICGVATILVASALGLQGDRDSLNPSVKVTWGDKTFQTAAKTYTPGTDIFNPSFDQAFQVPLTADMLASAPSFQIQLLNKTDVAGSTDIGFNDVVGVEGMAREESFDVGGGAKVRARISVHGVKLAE